jgi:hypothetical protein
MARRRDQADGEPMGMVPPEFAELFAGVKDTQVAPRLRRWMETRFGSAYADIFWLTSLGAAADRDSTRLDAIKHIHLLLYGKAPERVIVQEEKPAANALPTQATGPERAAALIRVLHGVGHLSHGAAAVRVGGAVDAEVEQVPPENGGDDGGPVPIGDAARIPPH